LLPLMVPTITFRLLYCLFVIENGRRKILHFNVTAHATAEWALQQLRETFSESALYRYVVLDHDSKFDAVSTQSSVSSASHLPSGGWDPAPWRGPQTENSASVVSSK